MASGAPPSLPGQTRRSPDAGRPPVSLAGRPASLAPCTISIQRKREWTALLVRGDLDLASAGELLVRGAAELDRGRPLLVELAGLEFADVAGVRALMELVTDGECRLPPVEVELHDPRGQVLGMLRRVAEWDPSYRRLVEPSLTNRAE